MIKASDRRAFFCIFLSLGWLVLLGFCSRRRALTADGCQLAQLPAALFGSTCTWVALPKAAWHVTSGLPRGSEDKQLPTKYSAAGMMFWANYCRGQTLFCHSHWSFRNTRIHQRRKGRRSKYCIKWKRMQLLESWFNMQEIRTPVSSSQSEKENSHSA